MKTWNTPEISELNITETAVNVGGAAGEWNDNLNLGDGIKDPSAIAQTGFYAAEVFFNADLNGDGVIGRPNNTLS